MKILMVAPTPYFSDRGCHIRIFGEAQALTAAGHSVTIATYHLGRNVGTISTIRIPRIPWYRKTDAGPSWQKPLLDIILFLTILFRVRKKNIDILHAHLHEGAWIGFWLKVLWKKPLLLDAQGSLVQELESYKFLRYTIIKKKFSQLERFLMHHADSIVTSSATLATWMREKFPASTSRITCVADAIPDSTQNKTPHDNHIHNATKPMTIVYAGGFGPQKGVDVLLDAFTILRQKNPLVKLLLIGDDPQNTYHNSVQKLDILDSVTFTGHANYFTLRSLLQNADIAVDPKPIASSESSGKILEYLAAGLPIVTFDRKQYRLLLAHSGMMAQEQTAHDLANALAYLLNHSEERKKMQRAAIDAIKNEYWSTRIHSLITIYEHLLAS